MPDPLQLTSTPPAGAVCSTRWSRGWTLERVLFAIAGTVVLLSALLAATVSPWFLILTALVGVNQWLLVLAGDCPSSWILRHTTRLRAANDG